MKFAMQINPLVGTNPSATDYIEMAQHVEELGFSSLWVSDHVAIPKQLTSAYPYSKDGSLGFPTDRPWLDCLSLISMLGACTRTIRLGTGVLVVPYRHPVDLGKRIITADFLTGGRLAIGVGIGWLVEEFDCVGVPFEERGTRTDEALQIIKLMCAGGDTTFKGRIFNVPDMHVYPKPVRKPHPPFLIGGKGARVTRRIVEHGDGWHPGVMPVEELRSELARLSTMMEEKGRKMSELQITLPVVMDLSRDNRKEIETLEELGVHEVVTMIPSVTSSDIGRSEAEKIARTFLS